MKNALLLVAHGSRRAQSNDEIRDLAQQLNGCAAHPFDVVDCAFLELAEPSIPDGIGQLARAGMRQLVILPYFLSDGRHVHEDIPAEIAIGRRQYPDVSITLAPYIGAAPSMPQLLLRHACESGGVARRKTPQSPPQLPEDLTS